MPEEPRSLRDFQFELTGGVLCFDFANTVDSRCAPERRIDNLTGYSALALWARQSGALPAHWADTAARLANEQPEAAARALRNALELREAIYRVFSAVAVGERTAPQDLLLLSSYAQQGLAHMQLRAGEDGFKWVLSEESDSLLAPLWPVAKSAADLLVSGELGKVRECAAGNCGWLFLDHSRNQSRRWCDMKICGNREKARLHHRRRTLGTGKRAERRGAPTANA